MSLDVGLVVRAMRHLLDEVGIAATATSNILPERQYITTGGAVYDCDQVTVSAMSITTGIAGAADAGAPVSNCPPGWHAAFELAIVRTASEAPAGRRGSSAPTVECIELDTDQADKDAACLTKAVQTLAGPDWDQYGSVPASIQFGEVQGGLTAVVLSITLNLWDLPREAV